MCNYVATPLTPLSSLPPCVGSHGGSPGEGANQVFTSVSGLFSRKRTEDGKFLCQLDLFIDRNDILRRFYHRSDLEKKLRRSETIVFKSLNWLVYINCAYGKRQRAS